MNMAQDHNSVEVLIRVQPSSHNHLQINESLTTLKCGTKFFNFDHILTSDSNQQAVFSKVGTRIINNVLNGYNSCVFVYGQTGSGKTYTMTGIQGNQGLVQRCMDSLWQLLQDSDGFQIQFSYLEIYNQQIFDLLADKQGNIIKVREHTIEGFYVENLKVQTIETKNQMLNLLQVGLKNRHKGATKMNRQSSRSHSILTLKVLSKNLNRQTNISSLKISKLHFVDLAGSEKQKSTQTTGDRLKQASNINKSLTHLSLVISKLSANQKHIPYRSSKLTLILKDSLGGNSKTMIIGTISSKQQCFQQTLSTLYFMEKAKMVKLNAKVNEEVQGSTQQLKKIIKDLKQQILSLQTSGSERLCQQCEQLRSDYTKLQGQNEALKAKINLISSSTDWKNNIQNGPELIDLTTSSDQQEIPIDEKKLPTIKQECQQNEKSSFHSFLPSLNCNGSKKNPIVNRLKQKQIDNMEFRLQIAQKQYIIQRLTNQLQKIKSSQEIFQPVIKLIQENLQNLKFTECQKVILKAQFLKIHQIQTTLSQEQKAWLTLQSVYKQQIQNLITTTKSKPKTKQSKTICSQTLPNNNHSQEMNSKSLIDKLQSQNTEIKVLLKIAQAKIQSYQSHHESMEMQNLKLQLQTLNEANRFLQSRVSEYEQKFQDKQKQIREKIEKLDEFQNNYKEDRQYLCKRIQDAQRQAIKMRIILNQEQQRYTSEINGYLQEKKAIEKMYKQSNGMIREDYNRKLKELQRQIELKKKQSTKYFSECNDLKIKWQQQILKSEQTTQVCRSLQKENKLLKQQLKRTQTVDSMESQQLYHQLETKRIQSLQHQRQIKLMEKSIEHCKKNISIKQMKLKNLQSNINQKNKLIESLMSKRGLSKQQLNSYYQFQFQIMNKVFSRFNNLTESRVPHNEIEEGCYQIQQYIENSQRIIQQNKILTMQNNILKDKNTQLQSFIKSKKQQIQ